jgi:hypothetical protein
MAHDQPDNLSDSSLVTGHSSLIRHSGFGFRVSRRRRAAIHWAILAFLLAFAALTAILIWYYLVPAGQAAKVADPHGRAQLRAVSALLLAVVLFVLLVGLILTFRVGRFFFPRPPEKPAKTQYVDAWAESAKRMKTPPSE